MEIPKKIICSNQAYNIGSSQTVSIPINDIYKFKLFHKSGCNGTQIQVVIKPELLTSMKSIKKENGKYDIENKDEYGIFRRKYDMGLPLLRNKDMPKFVRQLRKLFQKKKVLSETKGLNPGTRYVKIYTQSWKEITIEELKEVENE